MQPHREANPGLRDRLDCAPKVRFAIDSALEEDGFEPSVPPGMSGEAMDD
jgi:hypothetical protein